MSADEGRRARIADALRSYAWLRRLSWLAALALLALLFQGQRGIWEPDEGRYTAVAAEMVQRSDWMHPVLHSETPHWTKPPLAYWAIAGSFRLLGRSEMAARLPGALAFALTIVLVAELGRRLTERRTRLAALLYAIAPLPFFASNVVNADTLLALWETLAVGCYVWAQWGEPRRRTIAILSMWTAFALAFLTKGPPGLLPLAAILAFRALLPRSADRPALRWLPGLAIVLVVGGSWYLAVVLENPQLGRTFLWDEFVLRVFTGHHERNPEWYKPLTVYGSVLLAGTLPWTVPFFRALVAELRQARPVRWKAAVAADPRRWFLILWILVPLAVFLVSRSRMLLYPLPLFVPMSLLTAQQLERGGFSWSRGRTLAATGWAALLVASRFELGQIPYHRDAERMAGALREAHPGRLQEVVFVETEPYLGLQLYLGAEVERIAIEAKDAGKGEYQNLCEELAEAEEPRLWIVPQARVDEFLRVAVRSGSRFERRGSVSGKTTYELFKVVEGP
jgi:4-amino-4-deoxy-L-arabinose transferase